MGSGLDNEQAWSGLMRAALSGDQEAYQQLLVAITPHLRTVARRSLSVSAAADVEDVVQDALLAIHLKRASWDATRPIAPWLNAVVYHKAIDALRRKGHRGEVEIDSATDIAAAALDGDRAIDVETALASLDERQRLIVEQMSIQGRTAAEVGSALDMSESAVRVALHRALKRLARRFNGSNS